MFVVVECVGYWWVDCGVYYVDCFWDVVLGVFVVGKCGLLVDDCYWYFVGCFVDFSGSG